MGFTMANLTTILICWGLLHIVQAGGGSLRGKVIDSYLDELNTAPLDDQKFRSILDVIISKVKENGEPCVLTDSSGCLLYLTTDGERSSRSNNIKIRPYLMGLVSNLTRRSFPKVATLLSDIFKNETALGTDLHAQFDTTAQILLIKTLEKATLFLSKLNYLKAPLLTLLTLTLVFCTVSVAATIVKVCAKEKERRREKRLKKYENYYQRRQMNAREALEI